ncbi:hypothetical protein [Methylobacterium sp. Leaf91]|uniref:hypothetical protein n=1 Tax=Methylobacterium sp. Leaf91 TaxID=1736247 RepID=UPI0007006415|nr:hypothetical protein [Methylobacterium sp. Leaf91]KQO94628.1 hypothetical protein ASF32_19135 [Methylobacterium sp. Leaf91]
MDHREPFRLPDRDQLHNAAVALGYDADAAAQDAEALDRLPQGSGAHRRAKALRDRLAAETLGLLAGLDSRTLEALRFGLDPHGFRR